MAKKKIEKVVNKLEEQELESVLKSQDSIGRTVQQIGMLESDKHELLHTLASLRTEQEKIKSKLEEKYGSININLNDGSFEEIKADKQEEEK